MGSGCTCPAHSVIKALLRHLMVERDEVVILDMEAGIEHLGRGTAEHVDAMLVVTDANRKSLEIARNIFRMAADSGIAGVSLVGNRVTGPEQERIIRTFAEMNGIPVIAMVPFDQGVMDNGISGAPLREDGSPALRKIALLAEKFGVPVR